MQEEKKEKRIDEKKIYIYTQRSGEQRVGVERKGEEKRRTPAAEQRFVALSLKADVKTFRTFPASNPLKHDPGIKRFNYWTTETAANDEKNSIANSAGAIKR